MDYSQSFELSTKNLRHLVDNSDAIKKILENKEKRNLFFTRFPYEKLFNLTTVDGPDVALCVKLLELFADCEDFYDYDERINHAIEYTLINLSHVTKDCKEMFLLLRLLSKLLYRNNNSLDSSFRNIFDKERILEVLVKLTKFKSVQKSNFKFYSIILSRLLDTNFSNSLDHLVSALFETFVNYDLFTEQLVVCKAVMFSPSKLLNSSYQNIWDWLLWKCPKLLAQSEDLNVLEDILHCLVTLLEIWLTRNNVEDNSNTTWAQIDTLFQNLYKITSDICMHSSNIRLKFNCYKLLKFVVSTFLNGEMMTFPEESNLSDFDNLPEDVEFWPKSDTDLFFCICHICVEHSRLIWKRKDVLHAIMRCFYNRRHFVKMFILKSVYYLYPKLIDENVDISIVTLGDDLLSYFEKLCSGSYLYSYSRHQLKWVLERASKTVKLTVLAQWIIAMESNETLEDELIWTIKECKGEVYLLQLMMANNDLGNVIGLKSVALLRKITSSQVSRFIACLLPLTILEKPTSFHQLLLAEPGVSLSSHHSALICSLMGAILPNLRDMAVLRGACIFSSKLLSKKRNEPCAILGFCRNVANIQQIITISGQVDDDTGVEIIKLLKVVVVVQIQNKLRLDYNLKEDFRSFLKGSTEQIKRSLWLLYYTIIYKHSIIIPHESYTLDIYHTLLDYCLNSALQSVSFRCVIVLLKRAPWLAQTISTSIFVETVCLSLPDDTFTTNVLKILDIWLQLVRKEPYNGFAAIPETAIRSFVKRANIQEIKIYYSKNNHFITRLCNTEILTSFIYLYTSVINTCYLLPFNFLTSVKTPSKESMTLSLLVLLTEEQNSWLPLIINLKHPVHNMWQIIVLLDTAIFFNVGLFSTKAKRRS